MSDTRGRFPARGPTRPSSDRSMSTGYRHHPYDAVKRGPRTPDANGSGASTTDSESTRLRLPDDDDSIPNSLKVASTRDAKELASRIVSASLIGEPPALLTIGNTSINQAVKAIAIARQTLASGHGLELSFQPAFRHEDRTRPLIAFYLHKEPVGSSRYSKCISEGKPELAVASQCKITALAGAMSNRIRENSEAFGVALGVDAVANAVLAVGNARIYLEEDKIDIKAFPEFTKVQKAGEQRSAMKFVILGEPF